MEKLHYIFHSPNQEEEKLSFSLTKGLSEWINNFDILNNLVGTLLKRDSTGRFVPYLAKKWSASDDRKKWQFQLRSHLKCDNGEPIIPESFVQLLAQQLLEYTKSKKKSLFEQLEGWEDFLSGDKPSIAGLFAQGDTVHFHFTSVPSEFLEVISILYFGYWHPDNKNLAKENKFISSAGYSLSKFQKANEITLIKRKDK